MKTSWISWAAVGALLASAGPMAAGRPGGLVAVGAAFGSVGIRVTAAVPAVPVMPPPPVVVAPVPVPAPVWGVPVGYCPPPVVVVVPAGPGPVHFRRLHPRVGVWSGPPRCR